MKKLEVYLELGSKRTFAAALDWPGWCRAGKDESSALQALFDYAPRYSKIIRPARLGFEAPKDIAAFEVMERLKGNATTDFGAPDIAPKIDEKPIDDEALRHIQAILKACWKAFDEAIETAEGKTLRKGPRGGGRTQTGIREHVLGSESSYLGQLGGKAEKPESAESLREAILKTLEAAAHGEIPAHGPRGGKRWLPRYFVRREAWHVLDHIWEIEDRLGEAEE